MADEAPDAGPRVFWCNTNRGNGAGGNSLEQQMHARCFAAAWSGVDHPHGMFNYPDHMRRVCRGDLIVMYANGVGAIGIGRVAESRLELLFPDHPDRFRDYATEGHNLEEWRIPVEWLAWDEANPCAVESLRSSFQEITDHADRVLAVREHFRAVLAVVEYQVRRAEASPAWRQIPNDRLTLADIPAAGAPWDAITEFALSYYCHTDGGSLGGEHDHRHPPLAADLDRLRAWLFSQQRSIRGGYMGDPDDNPVMLAPIRQVIEAIRLRVAASAG